jgi:hypothetical protein
VITDQQIASADLVAAEAAHDLAAIERETAQLSYTEGVGARIAAATWRARHTASKAAELRARQTEQLAVTEARGAAEKALKTKLPKMSARLTASRDDAVVAIQDAEQAMVRMIAAVGAHNQAVKDAASELIEAGLPMTDIAGDHDMGGDRRGTLRLQGELWAPVDPSVLLARSVGAAARSVFGPNNPVAAFGKHFPGVHSLTRMNAAQIVDRVAKLPEAVLPPRIVIDREPVQGPPVVWRYEDDRRRAEQRRDQLRKHNEQATADMERIAASIEEQRQARVAAARQGSAA